MSNIDSTDKKILKLLQKDFRMSVTNIARELGITHNAIKYRMNKLREMKVVRHDIDFLNPETLGKNLKVVFLIEAKSSNIENCLMELKQLSELYCVYRTLGGHQIVAIGLFSSRPELSEFMDKKLAKITSISRCHEHTVAKIVKEARFSI